MTYRGVQGSRKNIGIKPSADDHAYVRTLSVMGIGVRQICVAVGERFKLGKPMSRMTLYWHFRKDLGERAKGRKPRNGRPALKRAWERDLTGEMKKLIEETKRRNMAKRHGEKEK